MHPPVHRIALHFLSHGIIHPSIHPSAVFGSSTSRGDSTVGLQSSLIFP